MTPIIVLFEKIILCRGQIYNALFYVLSQHEKEKIIETVQWKHECEKRIRINNKEEKLNALPMRETCQKISTS